MNTRSHAVALLAVANEKARLQEAGVTEQNLATVGKFKDGNQRARFAYDPSAKHTVSSPNQMKEVA
jgi:hypothetical protein